MGAATRRTALLGFCPRCGGRRVMERAAWWMDRVIPHVATRQWVLTVPWERRWLLLFQGLYFQPEVSANPRVQQACDDVRTALQLDRHYREVESELDRLAQVETARADERMGTVMEILTLVSLVGTVDAVAQGLNEGMGEDQNWLRAVLALVTLLSVAVLRRRFRA